MAERSKLTDPPETCRPSIGVGAPGTGNPGGARVAENVANGLKSFIDPAKYIGAELVRATAREVALVMVRENARTLCKVMGLHYDEIALVLKLACVEFTDMHHNTTTPEG